jgi:hypothetical protein
MHSSSAAVVRLLLAHHVLPPSAVVNGDLSVIASRRDRYTLHDIHHAGTVVCTVKTALHESARPFLAAEGAILEYLQRHAYLAGIAPRCHARDVNGGFLALEHIAPPERGRSPDLQIDARASANVLASLHRNTVQTELGVTGTLPPIMEAICLGRTPNPQALARLFALSSSPSGILEGVGTTARNWQRHSLIHTDVKREHWLVRVRGETSEPCLIDWELARSGDPAWDVASVLHSYLIDGAPSAQGDHSPVLVPPQGHAFLRQYRDAVGGRVWNRKFEHRIALSVATRSVQTALETLATGGDWGVLETIRTAELIFRDPYRFAEDIMHAADVPHTA